MRQSAILGLRNPNALRAMHALSWSCKRLHVQLCAQKRCFKRLFRTKTGLNARFLHCLSRVCLWLFAHAAKHKQSSCNPTYGDAPAHGKPGMA